MRCSRITLSLLLAVLGGAAIALGPAHGPRGMAADYGLQQPYCVDTLHRADESENATDGRDQNATNGEQPWTTDYCESHSAYMDGTPAAATQEDHYEDGVYEGLGVLGGPVVRFNFEEAGFHDHRLKVPHIGWNQIRKQADAPLLAGVADEAYVYFVHSYYVEPEDRSMIISVRACRSARCSRASSTRRRARKWGRRS